MRAALPIALGLGLAGLILLGRPPTPEPPPHEVGAVQPLALPPATASDPALARSLARSVGVRIEDLLTGEPLELEVEVQAPDVAPFALSAAAGWDPAALAPETSLHYRLPDGTPWRASAKECLREVESGWVLALPYRCRIVLQAPAGEATEVEGEYYLCRPPPPSAPHSEGAAMRGPFDLEGVDMTPAGALNWALRSRRIEILHEAPMHEPALLAAEGPAVIAAHLADGRAGYAAVELVPGEELRVHPSWHYRPRLAGVLLDASGEPIPHARVRLAVAMDLADYDFRPSDPHALAVLRIDGVLRHTMTRRLKTDAEGRFETVAPIGTEYALYTHTHGGYVMWTTLREPAARADHLDLVLQLAEPSDESAVTVQVRRPDGSPFGGARLLMTVVNDVPFVRQWPEDLFLDADGTIRVLGLQVGEEVGMLVYHEDLEGAFGANYMHVPPSRILTVDVPAERLIAAAPAE